MNLTSVVKGTKKLTQMNVAFGLLDEVCYRYGSVVCST